LNLVDTGCSIQPVSTVGVVGDRHRRMPEEIAFEFAGNASIHMRANVSVFAPGMSQASAVCLIGM
jgi:hypothetical protein